MIKKITDLKDIEKCFYLADKFIESSHTAEYDKETVLNHWGHILKNNYGVFLAYFKNGVPVGIIAGIKHPDMTSGIMTATEAFWFVDPKHRGIGRELLSAFEQWAKEEGCQRVLMMALFDSMVKKVINVYKKSGYKPVEVTYMKEV